MTGVRGLVAAVALAVLAACGGGDNGPDAFVRGLYAPYIAGETENVGLQNPDNLTSDFSALIERADAYSRLLEEPIIDYDPIANGQEWEIKSVDVAVTAPAKDGAATVDAKFDSFGSTKTVTYALRQENGAWKIDDIRADGQSFRAGVEANLKPAGEPAAMEAPVRVIYVRYAAERTPEPMHRWVAFSEGLRPLMEKAAAMGKRADNPVLDFDPALGGTENAIGVLAYEPVSSAVIARFQNSDAQKIIVYDLVREGDLWKIANIRSPGEWDLLQKLTAAGITE